MKLIELVHFERFVFLYNLCAHFLLVILYVMFNKNINNIICKKNITFGYIYNILFVLGHLLISAVMLDRISEKLRGTLPVSVFGSIAHILLFTSCILSFFYGTSFDIYKFIFLISQIGMVYVYSVEHIMKDIYKMTSTAKLFFILPLFLLFIYYIHSFFGMNGPLRYAYLGVCFVYLFLMILAYYQNNKQDYISIF